MQVPIFFSRGEERAPTGGKRRALQRETYPITRPRLGISLRTYASRIRSRLLREDVQHARRFAFLGGMKSSLLSFRSSVFSSSLLYGCLTTRGVRPRRLETRIKLPDYSWVGRSGES